MSTSHSIVTGRKLPTRAVCDRYLKSGRTILRWQNDPQLNFPKPMIVNGRKFFDEDQLIEWERAQIAR